MVYLLVFISQLHSFGALAQIDGFIDNTGLVDISMPGVNVEDSDSQLEIKLGSQIYKITNPQSGEADYERYSLMAIADQQKFNSNRKIFLGTLARALNSAKYGLGVISVVNEKIKLRKEKNKDAEEFQLMQSMPSGIRDDFMAARARAHADRESQFADRDLQELTFRQRAHQVVEGFLRAIDRQLWQQASLFSRSNEFGVIGAAGLELLGGVNEKDINSDQATHKGWGGLMDLGISIGYNSEERSMIIQVFTDYEQYKSTLMKAVFIAGAVTKVGPYISYYRNGEDGGLSAKGESFYPPFAPGYSSSTPDKFTAGFSSGLTWPPSPVGDLLTYTNSTNNKTLLRISLSPFTNGFIRLQTGLGIKEVKSVHSSLRTAMENLFKNKRAVLSCSEALM